MEAMTRRFIFSNLRNLRLRKGSTTSDGGGELSDLSIEEGKASLIVREDCREFKIYQTESLPFLALRKILAIKTVSLQFKWILSLEI